MYLTSLIPTFQTLDKRYFGCSHYKTNKINSVLCHFSIFKQKLIAICSFLLNFTTNFNKLKIIDSKPLQTIGQKIF